jgi:hypothetical protein
MEAGRWKRLGERKKEEDRREKREIKGRGEAG